MTAFCTQCGGEVADDDKFCSRCGAGQPEPAAEPEAAAEPPRAPEAEQGPAAEVAPVEPVAPEPLVAEPVAAAAPAAEPRPAADDTAAAKSPRQPLGGWASTTHPGEFNVSSRTNIDIAGRPLELWVPIALFVAAGVYLLQLSIRAMPDTFRLFGLDFFPGSFAFALVVILFMLAGFGAGLVAVGALLYRGDRIARGIAYVAVTALAGIVIFDDATTTGEVLILLGGLVAAAVLAFAPAVKDVFAVGPQSDQPTSIIVARVSLALWLILLAVGAIIDFCLESLGGKYIFYGVILAALAVSGFFLFTRLGLADPRARVIVTIAAVCALVFLLLGRHTNGLTFLVGLTVAIPVCLWIPPDARAYYGDAPLVTVREPA